MEVPGFFLNNYQDVGINSGTSHNLDIDESKLAIYQTIETYVYDYENHRYLARKQRIRTEFKKTAFLGGPGNIFKRFPCPHCPHQAVTSSRLQCHIFSEHSHLRFLSPNIHNFDTIKEYYVSPSEFDQLRSNLNFFGNNGLRPELEEIEYPEKLPITFYGFNNLKDDFEKSNVSNDSIPSTSKLIHTSSHKLNAVEQLGDNEQHNSNNDFISREDKSKSIKKSFSCSQCDYITVTAALLKSHKQKLHCDDLKLKTVNHNNNYSPSYSLRKNRNVSIPKIKSFSNPSSFINGEKSKMVTRQKLSQLNENNESKNNLLITKTVQPLNSKLKNVNDLSSNEAKLENVISRKVKSHNIKKSKVKSYQKVKSHNDELEEFENGSVIKVESITENDKKACVSNNQDLRNQNSRKCKRKAITTELAGSSDDNIVKKSGSKSSPGVRKSLRSQNRSNKSATLNKSNDSKNNILITKTVQPLNFKLKNDNNLSSNEAKLENVISRNIQNVESHNDQLEAFDNKNLIKVESITENDKIANINPIHTENRINKNDHASNNKDLRKRKRQAITTEFTGSSDDNIVKKSDSKPFPGVGKSLRSQNRSNTLATLNKTNNVTSKLSQMTENNDSTNNLLTKTVQPLNSTLKDDASLSSNGAKLKNVISVNIQNSSYNDQVKAFEKESLVKVEYITENDKTANINSMNIENRITKNNSASNNQNIRNQKNRKCKIQANTTDLTGNIDDNSNTVRSQNKSNKLVTINKSDGIKSRSTSQSRCQIKTKSERVNLKSNINKTFACMDCDYVGKTSFGLHKHTKKEHGKQGFLCSECNFSSTRLRELQRHQVREHNYQRPYPCDICKFRAITQCDLRSHIVVCHPETLTMEEGNFKVESSNTKQSSISKHKTINCRAKIMPSKSKDHESNPSLVFKASHKINDIFQCKDCDHIAKTARSLNYHAKMKHGKFTFSCSDCNFIGNKLVVLQRHQVNVHNYPSPYACDYCEYRGNANYALKAHIFRRHPEESVILKQGNFKVESSNLLKQPSASKHKIEPQSAEIMPSNSGKMGFHCSVCNYSANKITLLNNHQCLVHNYPLPFGCHYCTYKAVSKRHLKTHIVLQHFKDNE